MKTSLPSSKENLRKFFDNVLETTKASTDLLQKIENDIVVKEDGYYVYWPSENRGYLDEYYLILIAALLNKKNREWDDELDAYFSRRRDDNL